MPTSHAKMHLKSARQRLDFLMAKVIQKSYSLNCSHKCSCTFLHSFATSFSRKTILYETNNILYSPWNQKWNKTDSWSENYTKNKSEVTLDSFVNFAYQQLFAFKRFCKETRLSNILKTKNATKFIKTALERSCKLY